MLTAFDAVLKVDDHGKILETTASFYVIEKGQQPLLGKQTAQQLGVLKIGLPSSQQCSINQISSEKAFPKMKGIAVTLPIDRTVPPVIQPLRRCPIPLLDKVKAKLEELLQMDIIERVVQPTSWVSPLVPILKENGDLRLCIDMRRANLAIQRLNHPLPVFDDFLPRFRNAQYFTSLDIKQAFHQVELTEDCRDITTFISTWGLFRYKRLLFGVNCAPELYQNLMESILSKCVNVVVFIDDIVIFGASEDEHDMAVKNTLKVLNRYGILLNDHKCKFKQREIRFLGHKLSAEGVSPSDDKVKSILQFRAPTSKEELRSFLGLVTYVSRFIPNLASMNAPLRDLLKRESNFRWEAEHQRSFDRLKKAIGAVHHLGYYDPMDRTLVVTDASGSGLGAVLIQFKGKQPRVISYSSRSLSETEKSYPIIEKEALGIVWGIEKFRMYLLGINFELETDHRPLEALFTATSRPTARIERWLLRVQAFKFRVVYRKGSANLADCLSRLGSHVEDQEWLDESEVYIRHVVAETLSTLAESGVERDFDSETEIFIRTIQVSAALDIVEVMKATTDDEEMQKLKESILTNKWDNSNLKQYAMFRNEYTVANDLIMRGNKLVIPSSLRNRMCQLAHEGHPGETMMKTRLRDRCWWPGIDAAAVEMCKSCEGCRLVQLPDPPEPMKRRPLPEKAWVDIAIDFLGPMPNGEYILVVIDYFSRYMEIAIMTKITAENTIKSLKKIFRTWGPPRTITLDNAKQFVSTELREYCKSIGVHLNHTTPYWPSANGEVERQNRSLLKRMKIANALYSDWKAELDQYLEFYNNTPHSVTMMAPSELLQNRRLRSKMPHIDDLETVPPSTEFRDRDRVKKISGKEREDNKRQAKPSNISVGDTVLMKNLHPTNKLSTNFLNEKFTVIDRKGTNVTVQSTESGRIYDRNTSHLKSIPAAHADVDDQLGDLDNDQPGTSELDPITDVISQEPEDIAAEADERVKPQDQSQTVEPVRRSLRTPRLPSRFR